MFNFVARVGLTVIVILLFGSVTFAGGPANKVTGDFVRFSDSSGTKYSCEFTAHEAKNGRSQKGSMYCAREGDLNNWWEIDLSDADNSCVTVIDSEDARIGGLVKSAGTSANHLKFTFIGFAVHDGGEPGAYVDTSTHGVMNESSFDLWCESGTFEGKTYDYTVEEGNLQVHHY